MIVVIAIRLTEEDQMDFNRQMIDDDQLLAFVEECQAQAARVVVEQTGLVPEQMAVRLAKTEWHQPD